jgi:hypothetical protein
MRELQQQICYFLGSFETFGSSFPKRKKSCAKYGVRIVFCAVL